MKSLIVGLFILSASCCSAASFSDTPALLFDFGVSNPIGDLIIRDDYSLGTGINLGVEVLVPFLYGGKMIGFSAGLNLPSEDYSDFIFYEVPISIEMLIPFARESATSPYIGFGPILNINTADMKDTFRETKISGGITLLGGCVFAPEHFRSLFFDIHTRIIDYISIRDNDDFRFEFAFGIGFQL